MNLNRKDKEKLRNVIESKLYNYKGDKRVNIDKELLDDLIFEKDIAVLPDGRKLEIKFIVWSGNLLKKIDLGEVSFDNVEWGSHLDLGSKGQYQTVYGKENLQKWPIILSNTNAKIDFNKSFSRLAFPNNKIEIVHCDFSNVDLSNAHGELINSISSSDLGNTNIKLNLNEAMFIYNSNLAGADLSDITLPASVFVFKESSNFYIIDTNLCDTGIHIEYRDYSKLPIGMLSKYIKKKRSRETLDEEETKEYEDILYQGFKLSELLKNRWLDGCYINGKYKPNEEKLKLKKAYLLEQYETMKQDIINTTLESLSSQIRVLKK